MEQVYRIGIAHRYGNIMTAIFRSRVMHRPIILIFLLMSSTLGRLLLTFPKSFGKIPIQMLT